MKLLLLSVITTLIALTSSLKAIAENPKPEEIVVKVTAQIEYLDIKNGIIKDAKPIIGKSVGSGVIYQKYIITNHHVIRGYRKVTFEKDSGTGVEATFLGSSFCDDVAVFKITNKKDISNNNYKSNFKKNEKLIAFGYASNTKLGSITGQIASLYNEILDSNQVNLGAIQLDNNIKLGFSGGGVFDQQNNLVGINQSLNDRLKQSNIIPFYRVKKIISDLEGKRYIYSGGINGLTIYSPYLKKYGVIVTGIIPNTRNSGIQLGDIITEINDREIQPYPPYNTFCRILKEDETMLNLKGFHIKDQSEFNIQLSK
jgi:S1-C subfamily serine protease